MGEEKRRLPYIDYAKAVGIFLVVWGHSVRLTAAASRYAAVIRYIYAFHMPLFFILSGICLGRKLRYKDGGIDVKFEIKRAFLRLMIPYFFWCVVYTLIDVFTARPAGVLINDIYAAVCAITSLSLYIAVEHMTKNNANLIWFYLGERPSAFFVTVIFGSLAVIFAAILLLQGCGFLSALGEESIHIMALHYPPIPIIELVTGLWFRVAPDSICVVPAAVVTASAFAFAVLVFEPICRFVRRRVGLIRSHGKG